MEAKTQLKINLQNTENSDRKTVKNLGKLSVLEMCREEQKSSEQVSRGFGQ